MIKTHFFTIVNKMIEKFIDISFTVDLLSLVLSNWPYYIIYMLFVYLERVFSYAPRETNITSMQKVIQNDVAMIWNFQDHITYSYFWIYCLHKHIVIYFAIHGECNNLNGCNVIAYDVEIGRKEIEYVMMIQFFFISLSQKNWSMLPLAFVTSSTYFTTLSFFLSFMCG